MFQFCSLVSTIILLGLKLCEGWGAPLRSVLLVPLVTSTINHLYIKYSFFLGVNPVLAHVRQAQILITFELQSKIRGVYHSWLRKDKVESFTASVNFCSAEQKQQGWVHSMCTNRKDPKASPKLVKISSEHIKVNTYLIVTTASAASVIFLRWHRKAPGEPPGGSLCRMLH